MIKAVDTLVPPEVPPGSGETGLGGGAFRSEERGPGAGFLRIRRGRDKEH